MSAVPAGASFTRRPQWALRERLQAAGWHLLGSLAVAAMAAALVFWLWYPGPYRNLAGGRELFFLVVAVDVALGPLLTFAVFDRAKGWPHLRRDLAVIVALQLSALAYGLYTVHAARPVALVFELDRFRVIAAAEVYQPELPKAREELRRLPLTGPWALAVRESRSGEERNDSLFMAVSQGVDTSQRPIFWLPYGEMQSVAASKSRPLADLLSRYPDAAAGIRDELKSKGADPATARWLPVIARGDWVALLTPKGDVVGFAPLDGFF